MFYKSDPLAYRSPVLQVNFTDLESSVPRANERTVDIE